MLVDVAAIVLLVVAIPEAVAVQDRMEQVSMVQTLVLLQIPLADMATLMVVALAVRVLVVEHSIRTIRRLRAELVRNLVVGWVAAVDQVVLAWQVMQGTRQLQVQVGSGVVVRAQPWDRAVVMAVSLDRLITGLL